MKYRTRTFYTEEQKSLMWDRWTKGDSLHSIASLFDRHHPSISGILGLSGGIRPPKRIRSSLALTLSERENISRGIATRLSIRAIAVKLSRSLQTRALLLLSSCMAVLMYHKVTSQYLLMVFLNH